MEMCAYERVREGSCATFAFRTGYVNDIEAAGLLN